MSINVSPLHCREMTKMRSSIGLLLVLVVYGVPQSQMGSYVQRISLIIQLVIKPK